MLSLDTWLGLRHKRMTESGGASLVLGGTGHAALTASEEARCAAHLQQRVLPGLLSSLTPAGVTLMAAVAPGACRLYLTLASDWFRQRGIACETVALLAAPLHWIIADWAARLEASGRGISRDSRRRAAAALQALMEQCDAVVALYSGLSPNDCALPAARIRQYQRCGAVIAERSDILLAFVRHQQDASTSLTWQAVQWRRQPSLIPAGMSSLLPQERAMVDDRRALMLIDTQQSAKEGAAETLLGREEAQVRAEAEAASRQGNDLQCFDLLQRAAERGVRSTRLDYLRVLALVNSGSVELALEQYRELAPGMSPQDPDWLALSGRLQQELALAAQGEAARTHFRKAALDYFAAYRQAGSVASGIHAATMFLMSGQPESARALAHDVLRRSVEVPPHNEEAEFGDTIARAEAALLLGDLNAFQLSIERANAVLRDDFRRRALALSQLRMVCGSIGLDPALIDRLYVPPVLLLHRPDADEGLAVSVQLSGALPPHTLAYLLIDDPAGVALAEALLQKQVQLYLSIPGRVEDMAAQWQLRWGAEWLQRLEAVASAARRLTIIDGFLEDEVAWRREQQQTTTLGLSLVAANRLRGQWQWMRWHREAGGAARLMLDPPLMDLRMDLSGLRAALVTINQSVVPACVLPPEGRRRIGILFADFSGYQRIPDHELQQFWRVLMGAVAEVLEAHRPQVLLRSTWGDAVHVVTTNAAAAVEIALAIQELVRERQSSQPARLASLELRMAAHFAPAFEGYDPIREMPLYYGSQLSFAARIEPVVPPGAVFGSDAFVAQLALEAPSAYQAQYVGEVDLAKQAGRYRLYSLQRRR
jgi:hypothetical protein